jgi:hypothetical protein
VHITGFGQRWKASGRHRRRGKRNKDLQQKRRARHLIPRVENASPSHCTITAVLTTQPGKTQAPDLSNAQANIQAASKSAGAYFSSWGTWASEKRKGWSNKTPLSSPPPSAGPLTADMKRAEDFRREKESVVGDLKSPIDPDDKRSSLFFDAETDKEKEKEKGKSVEDKV